MPEFFSASEQALIEKAILPVVACGTDGSFRPIGSCWIFSAAGRDAWAFSAAHVFEEVIRSEERHERGVASMPDVLRAQKLPRVRLASTRLKALYRYQFDRNLMIDILTVHRDGLTDVAVCHLAFQTDAPSDCVFEKQLSIYSGPVPVGTDVAVVGYAGQEKTTNYLDEERGLAVARHFRHLTFEYSKVTASFLNGPRGPVGPCFEIDAPCQHGMSGGPILHRGHGNAMVGCGVVSRGHFKETGEVTMASELWPFYSYDIGNNRDENDKPLTFIDLARLGFIDDKANGPDHFRIVEANENGGKTIEWQRKPPPS